MTIAKTISHLSTVRIILASCLLLCLNASSQTIEFDVSLDPTGPPMPPTQTVNTNLPLPVQQYIASHPKVQFNFDQTFLSRLYPLTTGTKELAAYFPAQQAHNAFFQFRTNGGTWNTIYSTAYPTNGSWLAISVVPIGSQGFYRAGAN